jgi:hypothetical protein
MTTTKTKQLTETLDQLLSQAPTAEDFTFALYMLWSESVTINSREFQQVMANKSISRWFMMELTKQEAEYELLIKRYPVAISEDSIKLFLDCVFKLFSRFPKTLLEAAKKRETKPITIKVTGVRIEYSIVNWN